MDTLACPLSPRTCKAERPAAPQAHFALTPIYHPDPTRRDVGEVYAMQPREVPRECHGRCHGRCHGEGLCTSSIVNGHFPFSWKGYFMLLLFCAF